MAAEHDAINLAGIPNFPVDVLTDIVIRLAKKNASIPSHGGLSSFIVKHSASGQKILPKNSLARNRNTSNCRCYTSHIYNYSSFGKADDEVILDPSYDCYEASSYMQCNSSVFH
jgi:hypothetical protein